MNRDGPQIARRQELFERLKTGGPMKQSAAVGVIRSDSGLRDMLNLGIIQRYEAENPDYMTGIKGQKPFCWWVAAAPGIDKYPYQKDYPDVEMVRVYLRLPAWIVSAIDEITSDRDAAIASALIEHYGLTAAISEQSAGDGATAENPETGNS